MPKTVIESREIDFSSGEDTYGLKIFRQVVEKDGGRNIYWRYQLPHGVTVFPLTTDRKVIGVEESHPGVPTYVHLVGETMEEGEEPLAAAERGLLEETGYRAKQFKLLSTILENTGKSDRRLYFVLASGCEKIAEGEAGIKTKLFTPEEFSETMMRYYLSQPEEVHGGGNTLKAFALASAYAGFNPRF